MYRAFFGLGEAPFRITPDPRFLHQDAAVEAALRALTAGIVERAGLLLLVGEVGTGKTTLVRQLLDTLPERVRTVLVMHPTVAFDEILDHVLLELGLPVSGGGRDVLLGRLAEFLREQARDGDVAIFFDEAQALHESTLAALPDLLDLVTVGGRPAIQLVLAGQPELARRLDTPALAPLRKRIAVTARLEPLSRERVEAYVRARLERAGASDLDLFAPDALDRLARYSQGIPRVINVLCENALVAAFADGTRRITAPLIETVWTDYEPLHHPGGMPMPAPPAIPVGAAESPTLERSRRARRLALAGAVAVAVLVLLPVLATRPWRSAPRPSDAPPQPAPVAEPPAVPNAPAESLPSAPPSEAAAGSTEPAAAPPEEVAAERAAPPSAVDAVALVDRFWRAYQARDPKGLRALFAPEAAPSGKVLDMDPTGRGALVSPTTSLEAKPVGDRVAVRVPIVLSTHDDRGRAVRRHGVATWEIAMRDGAPRIVALATESGPVTRR